MSRYNIKYPDSFNDAEYGRLSYELIRNRLLKEGINCGYYKEQFLGRHGLQSKTTAVYIEDDPLILNLLIKRVNEILHDFSSEISVKRKSNEDQLLIKIIALWEVV